MKVVKAEILWTYRCNRKCSGCSMNTGQQNTRSLNDWIDGLFNLKGLGCKFAAFYGAEPLEDFHILPDVIRVAERLGIDTTVITSAPLAAKTKHKLRTLYDHGLRSLTTSYDIIPYDIHSKKKMDQAIPLLQYFQSLGPIRDVAAVVTITKKNMYCLPETIKMLSDLGIWTFCDLLHWDRGNPGTKCQGKRNSNLSLTWTDTEEFRKVMDLVLHLKDTDLLVHIDSHSVEVMEKHLEQLSWNCAEEESFPSWVTIDPNGMVFPCDDFKPKYKKIIRQTQFDMTRICNDWKRFSAFWKKKVKKDCRNCCWVTHIQANNIKKGDLSIGDYVHGKE